MQTVVNTVVSDAYFDPGTLVLYKEGTDNPFAEETKVAKTASVKRIITKIKNRGEKDFHFMDSFFNFFNYAPPVEDMSEEALKGKKMNGV
jgi:hypothetical protein